MRLVILFLTLSLHLFGGEKPVRVYVDVVGDLFHAGHVQFFQKAKALGDVLVVGIHNDEDCADYKRLPILTMEERRIVIQACRYVDEVVLNAPIGVTAELIRQHNIDIVVHGDDFTEVKRNEQYGVPLAMGIFRTVPYTPNISTTDLIQRIAARF